MITYLNDKTITVNKSKLNLNPRIYPRVIHLEEDEYYFDGVVNNVDHNYICNHQIKNMKYKNKKGIELLIDLFN
jgi:hypothetical protein